MPEDGPALYDSPRGDHKTLLQNAQIFGGIPLFEDDLRCTHKLRVQREVDLDHNVLLGIHEQRIRLQPHCLQLVRDLHLQLRAQRLHHLQPLGAGRHVSLLLVFEPQKIAQAEAKVAREFLLAHQRVHLLQRPLVRRVTRGGGLNQVRQLGNDERRDKREDRRGHDLEHLVRNENHLDVAE